MEQGRSAGKDREMKDKKENMFMGTGWHFFCKECHCFLGTINGWEFRGFAAGLTITGMDLCQKCAKKRRLKK